METSKHKNCISCNKRTKPKERRSLAGDLNQHLRQYLQEHFFVTCIDSDVICGRCRRIYYRQPEQKTDKAHESNDTDYVNDPDYVQPSASKTLKVGSPLSITLPISSTVKGHSQCFLCKKRGPKLVVVPSAVRYSIFIDRNLILPVGTRCCPGHLFAGSLTTEAYANITSSYSSSSFNRCGIMELINTVREHAIRNKHSRLDFDATCELTDADFFTLTGIVKTDFDDLCSHIPSAAIRDTHIRNMRTCIGILLTKLRSCMSNKFLATMFNISKDSIKRAISSARDKVKQYFTPNYIGFHHISRENIIKTHTRPLAQTLFGDLRNQTGILVIGETYIYIQKSGQFEFQRSTYSMHKHRNLVKPMMFVSTTGYIVSVIGPYLCNSKNNDASILNTILKNNIEEIQNWLEADDVVVVDRGFRDSLGLLKEFGIQTEIPYFLKRNQKQFSVEEANITRLVTKVRWIVESVNGRIKQWKFFDRVLPNTQIPYIEEYTKFVSALCNRYRRPLNTGSSEEDQILGAKMLYLSKQKNELMDRVISESLDKRSGRWVKLDALEAAPDFPKLSEDDIREITLGVYQLKLAKSYTDEHLDEKAQYEVLQQGKQLIRVRMDSRHISSKTHNLWVTYEEASITSWYCKCRAGARVVGTCSHIASVIWFLGWIPQTPNHVFYCRKKLD